MKTQLERAEEFRVLHAGPPLVIPNPWDAGSARLLEGLGFKALATTSSGFAFTLGRLDGEVTLDEVLEHVRQLAAATELPLSVDLEHGYGAEPGSVGLAIERVAEAGAVGASIEDYDPAGFIYDAPYAAARIASAAEAASTVGFPFVLTARAENHIRGAPNLDDTIARLRAFADAGADVLYAPGLRSVEEIRAVCEAVAKPVNVLAVPELSLSAIFEAGAQRVSLGGSLAWATHDAMVRIARRILEAGDLSGLAPPAPTAGWSPSADRDSAVPRREPMSPLTNVTGLRVALTVADFDRAVAFYRDTLGLRQLADWSSETGRVVLLAAGGATLELLDESQADTVDAIEAGRRISGTVRFALEVADSEETARRLIEAGAEQVAPPVTTPWGDRNARVRAPDGMQLTLFTEA